MAEVQEQFNEVLERNRNLSKTYRKPYSIAQVSTLENRRIFMLSCSDGRINPNEIFGLKNGEINIIRNAGATANEDVLRSLEIMGTIVRIGLIVVLKHTDCGGLFRTDEKITEMLSERAPEHANLVKDKVFGCFGHIGIDESVRQQVDFIRAWPFLPSDAKVVGYAYDIDTGLVREVVPPQSKL